MANACPECSSPLPLRAWKCEKCGLELERPAPPPPQKVSDGAQYAIIGGVIVAIVAVLLILSSAMGSTKTCQDCRGKGSVTCLLCKDGVNKCLLCKGTGNDPQTFSTCMRCNGSGRSAVCERCRGTPKKTCPSCGGAGKR